MRFYRLGSSQDTVEEILREGADVNHVHGLCLPLHCACSVGNPAVVELLLDYGAEVISIQLTIFGLT